MASQRIQHKSVRVWLGGLDYSRTSLSRCPLMTEYRGILKVQGILIEASSIPCDNITIFDHTSTTHDNMTMNIMIYWFVNDSIQYPVSSRYTQMVDTRTPSPPLMWPGNEANDTIADYTPHNWGVLWSGD